MTAPNSLKLPNGYMLDTTEFNAVAKGEVLLSSISSQRLFATHVQLDEIDKTPCERTRAQLRAAFEEIAPQNLPTQSARYGASANGVKRNGQRMTVLSKLCSLVTKR